jgi:hypothetical protein
MLEQEQRILLQNWNEATYGSPNLGGWVVALLVDLEPDISGSISFRGICHFAHIDDDGAEVVAADSQVGAASIFGLSVHLHGHSLTS